MTAVALVVAFAMLVVSAAVMAVLTAAEASVRLLSRSRVRRLAEAEVHGSMPLDALAERPSRLAAAAGVWRALAFALSGAIWGWAAVVLLETDLHLLAGVVAGLVAAIALFALGEALPRTLAVQNPEKVALAAAPPALRLVAVLAPLARSHAVGWVKMASLVAEEPVTDAWLTGDEYGPEAVADEETVRDEAEEAFLDAVVEFGSTIVREVMVPRTDMVSLEDSATIAEAVELIRATGLSRVPVYHETVDDVVGVLFAKDLLGCMGTEACPATVAPIAREPYFVPETKPVDELLVEMRQRKTHMALVADEYGGTAGLVTIEDLIEEIVGEIFDEYDRPEQLVTTIDDGTLLLDARLPISDFNDLLGTEVELEADSIGGLFVELAGHIPEPGESLEVEGVRITVRDMEGNRVRRLLVEPRAEAEKEEPDA